jgi:hypothetical protein
VRGHHQAARHPVGGRGAEPAAYQVQAGVDRRGGTGGGQHVAVVDVEHRGVHGDVAVARGELVDGLPMRHRRTPGQQARVRDGEGTEAQPGDRGAAIVGPRQDLPQCRAGGATVLEPGRHDHDVGLRGRRRAGHVPDRVALGGADRAGAVGEEHRRPVAQALPGDLAEDQLRHGEMEHGDAVEGVDSDPQGTRRGWHDSIVRLHVCQWHPAALARRLDLSPLSRSPP